MRSWSEINIDALKYNFCNIKKLVGADTKIMSVVKANAYGHGYEECCRALLECGTYAFAVATVPEAKQIRRSGFDTPILILGVTDYESIDDIVEFDITPGVCGLEFAEKLSERALKAGKNVKIHIKIDTGMSRIGFVAGDDNEKTVCDIVKISELPNIEIEGIFSHFACADEENPDYTNMQFSRFMKIVDEIEKAGVKIPIKHIANSAAIMMYPEMKLDMVRAGIILYGYYPSHEVLKSRLDLRPVMTLKTAVSYIKELGEGVGVSYGAQYITDKKTKIATVPIGYADGYPRGLFGKAKMAFGDKLCNVIGRICMDQCMIDVTNVNNISTGDEVIVFGDGKITADDLAEWLGSISYEVLCMVSERIPRIYLKEGRVIKKVDYLEKI